MTTGTEQPPEECKGDKADTCDDIASWECYDNEVRQDCCSTCIDYEMNPIVIGCEYGNHQDTCNVSGGIQCYESDVRDNCCETCQSHETSDPDCQYGDKTTDCQNLRCQDYTSQQLSDCCVTCVDNVTTTTSSPQVTFTVTSTTTASTVTVPLGSVSTVSPGSSGMPEWFVPVAAGVGGLVVLLVLVIVILLCRRSRRSLDHLSPIDETMYNDYKLSKRPPIAPPRHPSTEKDWVQERRGSEEYSYINPKDVTDTESSIKRTAHDPLPLAPAEYLDLNDPVKYDYAQYPYGISTNGGLNNRHVTTNTYEKFPGKQPDVNESQKRTYSSVRL